MIAASLLRSGRDVRVTFDEPIDQASTLDVSCYRFNPPLSVREAKPLGTSSIVLHIEELKKNTTYQLSVQGVADIAAYKNIISGEESLTVTSDDMMVRYMPDVTMTNQLVDITGNGNHATLHNGVVVVPDHTSPTGAALLMDGEDDFAEASSALNLGPGDFTIAAWIIQELPGVIVSKGNGFGSNEQWSFNSAYMRIKNNFFSPAKGAVKNGHWTHLAFVRRGNTGIYYVNGKPSGEAHDMSVVGKLVNDRLLRIGRREYGKNPMYFKGRLCDLTIWSQALSTEQILEAALLSE